MIEYYSGIDFSIKYEIKHKQYDENLHYIAGYCSVCLCAEIVCLDDLERRLQPREPDRCLLLCGPDTH